MTLFVLLPNTNWANYLANNKNSIRIKPKPILLVRSAKRRHSVSCVLLVRRGDGRFNWGNILCDKHEMHNTTLLECV